MQFSTHSVCKWWRYLMCRTTELSRHAFLDAHRLFHCRLTGAPYCDHDSNQILYRKLRGFISSWHLDRSVSAIRDLILHGR